MEKAVAIVDKGNSFRLVDGSNYKITDSFQREFVVNFEEFVRISKAIFKDKTQFVTVGNRILNARYVYMVEPTKELTDLEKKKNFDKAEKIGKLKNRISTMELELSYWKKKKMDEKFGKDGWSSRINIADLIELTQQYWELHDERWKEISGLHDQVRELEGDESFENIL